MAPMMPPPAARNDDHGDDKDAALKCQLCAGLTIYKRAMVDGRLPPRCVGIEMTVPVTSEKLEELHERAGKPRPDNFSLYGVGLSVYRREWAEKGDRMPIVRGLGLMVVQSDPEDLMKRVEEQKRVRRELQRRLRGDQDGDQQEDDEEDDDEDLVEDFGDDDAAGLVEKGPIGASMPKRPQLPPVLPTMTFEEFMGNAVDGAKSMTRAMYNFWAKRLDGFGDRISWAAEKAKELEDQWRGKGGPTGA
ncbi:hypothetical protein P43SY_000435 [Pythium insidiosum]|uniref:Uncharacterized protein n=1 Tax=Pythium insidiosum TaxID=114742 RepID=A0AAD5QA17_PYTIN|nr:hypothetical protein P43SY_000435 [Pythium insidiosum]